MKIKSSKHHRVFFVTASTDLINSYRQAAKNTKSLSRFATLCKWNRAATISDKSDQPIVVLSHADEDPGMLTEKNVDRGLLKGFHILVMGRTTHPNQVAQWIRATRIRSEDRLHVVRIDDLESPRVGEFLVRVSFALGYEDWQGLMDAYLARDVLVVRGPKRRLLQVPASAISTLKDQPAAALQNLHIDPDGSFLFWPDLDVHLGWNQLLQIVAPEERRKAQQRSAAFNHRYGAAIRTTREMAGIAQTKIPGLTKRQLRRIEHGTCRATSRALAALAEAHGMAVNDYLDQIAKAMS